MLWTSEECAFVGLSTSDCVVVRNPLESPPRFFLFEGIAPHDVLAPRGVGALGFLASCSTAVPEPIEGWSRPFGPCATIPVPPRVS